MNLNNKIAVTSLGLVLMPCLVHAQVPTDPALAGIPAQVLAKIDPSI